MIRDTDALAEIRRSWDGVEALREKLQVSAFAAAGVFGMFPFVLSNAAHNLPFMHAYAVLNDVLEKLAKEGHFECKGRELGRLLEKSKNALPWDYPSIEDGKKRRDGVAHYGKLLERGDCWKFVDVVKKELVAWNVVES